VECALHSKKVKTERPLVVRWTPIETDVSSSRGTMGRVSEERIGKWKGRKKRGPVTGGFNQ